MKIRIFDFQKFSKEKMKECVRTKSFKEVENCIDQSRLFKNSKSFNIVIKAIYVANKEGEKVFSIYLYHLKSFKYFSSCCENF